MAASTYYELVQQLYIAFYSRPADVEGRDFWAGKFDKELGAIDLTKGFTAAQASMMRSYGASKEAMELYGVQVSYGSVDPNSGAGQALREGVMANLTRDQVSSMVDKIYINLLGRAPDLGGKAYWVEQIASGKLSASAAAFVILDGALNPRDSSGKLVAKNDDSYLVLNKINFASSFTSDYLKTLSSVESQSYNESSRDAVVEATRSISSNRDSVAVQAEIAAKAAALTKTMFADGLEFNVAASAASADEGQTITFTLKAMKASDASAFLPNQKLTYVIKTGTGYIDASDLMSGSLTGEVTTNANGEATVSITLKADAKTEGLEKLVFGVQNDDKTVMVNVNDSSTDPVKTYALTADADQVVEGNSVTFTLNTANVTDGTEIAYTITGVSAADVEGGVLTGKFVVVNGKATLVVTLVGGDGSEGLEKMKVSLDGMTVSKEVTVADNEATYDITNSSSTVVEGNTVTFTIATTNVAAGTELKYVLEGTGLTAEDIDGGALEGVAVVGADGKAVVTIKLVDDMSAEGVESFKLLLQRDLAGDGTFVTVKEASSVSVSDFAAGVVDGFGAGAANNANAYRSTADGTKTDVAVSTAGNLKDLILSGQTYFLDVRANDKEVREITNVSVPNNGSAQFDATTGMIKFTSEPGYVGTVTFSYTVTGSDTPVTVTLNVGTNKGGTSGDDLLVGSIAAETLNGGLGSDTIDGGSGADRLEGDAGDDFIRAYGNEVAITGGTGTDTLVVDSRFNNLDTLRLNQTENQAVYTSGSGPTITAFENVDAKAAAFKLTIVGGDAANVIVGSQGGNIVNAGAGNDTVTGGLGNDELNGEAGNDVINGGAGDDMINGGDGADSLVGGAGMDSFVYGTGTTGTRDDIRADVMIDGGEGTDTLVLAAATALIDSNAANATPANVSDFSKMKSIEGVSNVTGGGALNLQLGHYAKAAGINAVSDVSTAGTNDTVTVLSSFTTALTVNIGKGNDDINGSASTADLTIKTNLSEVTAADTLAGGSDAGDQLILKADGGTANLSGVSGFEKLTITADGVKDATVVVGADSVVNMDDKLVVDASALTAVDGVNAANFSFDGSAETDFESAYDVKGGSNADTIVAGAGNDTIDGGDGADEIRALSGNNYVLGGKGNDKITAGVDALTNFDGSNYAATGEQTGGGKNTIVGGEGADQIAMGDGNNKIYGDAEDTVGAGGGNDSIVAADGNDTIYAGAGDDSVTTGEGNNTVFGNAGKDTITAGAGNDTIDGGDDADLIKLGTGANMGKDSVLGGKGDDRIESEFSLTTDDAIDGGEGTDTLQINGGTGARVAYSEKNFTNVKNVEWLEVDGNADVTLAADTSFTTFDLRDGADQSITFTKGYNQATTVYVESGDDITNTGGADGKGLELTVKGLVGDIQSGNTIVGGTGNDVFELTADSVTADFANVSKIDRVVIKDAGNGGTEGPAGLDALIDLNNGIKNNDGVKMVIDASELDGFQFDSKGNAIAGTDEQLKVWGAGVTFALDVTGGKAGDWIELGNAANIVNGGDGNDTVLGGTGNDSISGQADNDSIDGGDGNDTLAGDAGNDVILAGAGNDVVTGGDGKDTITAGSGNDNIDAGNDDDRIDLEGNLSGADTIKGGAGNDVLRITASTDELSFAKVESVETLEMDGAITVTLGADIGSDKAIKTFDLRDSADQTLLLNKGYTNATTVLLNGDSVNSDRIVNSANVALTVKANGSDIDATTTITGGTAADVIELTADNGSADFTNVTKVETVTVVDAGSDTAPGAGSDITITLGTDSTAMTVDAMALNGSDEMLTLNGATYGASLTVKGGNGSDVITTGASVDSVVAGAGNDWIDGGAGNDIIFGDAGNDTIIGGANGDNLTGGAGADVFKYTATSQSAGFVSVDNRLNRDWINDFVSGTDKLDVGEIGALLAKGVQFVGNAADFTNANLAIKNGTAFINDGIAQAVYDQADGLLIIDMDDDGNIGGGDLVIDLRTDGSAKPAELKETDINGRYIVAASGFALGTDGRDRIDGTTGNETIRGGLDIDTINASSGDDTIVMVGSIAASDVTAYTGFDLTKANGGDVSKVVTLADLTTQRSVSDAATGDIVEGGAGTNDKLVVFGTIDLSGLNGGDTFVAHGIEQLAINSNAITKGSQLAGVVVTGDGVRSTLTIKDAAATDTVDLRTVSISGLKNLVVGNNNLVLLTQAQYNALTAAGITVNTNAGVIVYNGSTPVTIVLPVGTTTFNVDADFVASGLALPALPASVTSVVLKDTGAAIAALTAAQFTAASYLTSVDATDDALTISAAQYAAITSAKLTAGDLVTVLDTAANLTQSVVATLAGDSKVDVINVSPDGVVLSTVANVAAIGAKLHSSDSITVSDTGANIAAAIASLASNARVTTIDASDNAITLNVAGELAADSKLVTGDAITVSDTGANIATMTAAQLASTKIDTIDASDNAITFTVAKELAADAKLVAGDVITVSDTGANIATMTAAQAGSAMIDVIDASDNAVTLSVAVAIAADAKLVAGDTITVADTGANIASMTAAQIGSAKIDVIDATNDAVSLTVAQELAADSKLVTGDVVTVADTGANIASMTAAQLGSTKVDVIDASDNAVTLSVAQELAADAKLVVADTITVSDTGANIASMTSTQLGSTKIDVVDASDNSLTLSAAQLMAVTSAKLTAADSVTLSDLGSNIGTLSAANLGDAKLDLINATDNAIVFNAAQVTAAIAKIHSSDVISLVDTGANIASLSAAMLGNSSIGVINATDDAITLTVAQELAADVKLITNDAITISDTGANIATMTATQLDSAKLDVIDASDNAISLTVAQELAADDVLVVADTITVSDTGANIATMTVGQLGSAKIDVFNASNDSLALSVAQLAAVTNARLTAGDSVVMSDTGANLAAVAATSYAAYTNVDAVDASDNAVTFNVAQVTALTNAKLTGADVVTLSDTGAALAAVAATTYTAWGSVDVIDASDNAITLSVAQELVTDSRLVAGDVITVSDTGANIATMTAVQIGSAKIDVIDASDNAINLTVAKELAADAKLVAGDTITVSDTGANIASMTAAEIGSAKIDVIDASDNAITLTVAKELAADAKLVAGDAITVSDTGANIATMTAAEIGSAKIDTIDASDDAITLSVAKELAADAKLVAGDTITVSDTGANIASMTAVQIGSAKIDVIDASDNAITLSVAQELAADAALVAGDAITVSDTGANIATMTAVQLNSAKIDVIDASNDIITLNVAQELAADDVLVAGDTITLSDTGANIASMTAGEIGSAKIDVIDASNDVITLSVAQELAADAKLVTGDAITVSDTGANIATMTAGQIGSSKIDTIDASNDAITLSVAQELAADAKLVAGDTITVSDTGANIATMTAVQIGSAKIDVIDASNDAITLSVAQELAADAALVAGDTITVSDTGANIATMTAVQLNSAKIDVIDASNDIITLNVAQELAADDVLVAGDTITVSDTGANIATMTAAEIGSAKIDVIDASNDAITLSVAQELGADAKLVTGDAITVSDTGANIATMTSVQMGSSKIDTIDASNDAITLSVAQELAADAKLVTGDAITVSDTGANIATMTAVQLGSSKIDTIDASNDIITLSVAQELAADAKLVAGDTITLSDTGANIATMTAAELTSAKIDTINVSDNAVTLTKAHLTALIAGGADFDAGDALTFTGAFDASDNYATFNGIGGSSITLDDSDNAVTIDGTDLAALVADAALAFHSSDTITITGAFDGTSDGTTAYTAMTAAAVGGGSRVLDDSDNAVTFTSAQMDSFDSLSNISFHSGDALTITQANNAGIVSNNLTNVGGGAVVVNLTNAAVDADSAANYINVTGFAVATDDFLVGAAATGYQTIASGTNVALTIAANGVVEINAAVAEALTPTNVSSVRTQLAQVFGDANTTFANNEKFLAVMYGNGNAYIYQIEITDEDGAGNDNNLTAADFAVELVGQLNGITADALTSINFA